MHNFLFRSLAFSFGPLNHPKACTEIQWTGSSDDLPRRPKRHVRKRQQDLYINQDNQSLYIARATARRILGTQGRPVSDLDSAEQTEGGGLHARRPYVGLVLSTRLMQLQLAFARCNLRYACGKLGPQQSIFNLQRSDGRNVNVKITHLRRNEGCGC